MRFNNTTGAGSPRSYPCETTMCPRHHGMQRHVRSPHQMHLIPNSHDVVDLVDAMVSHIAEDSRTNTAQASVLKSVLRATSLGGADDEVGHDLTLWTLKKFMHAIDKLFLYGSVMPRARVKLQRRVFAGREAADGVTNDIAPGRVEIRLSTDEVQAYGRVRRYDWTILETAIHEMIHAFLILYPCQKGMCGMQYEDETAGTIADDPGHGPAFRTLLKEILLTIRRWGPDFADFGDEQMWRLENMY